MTRDDPERALGRQVDAAVNTDAVLAEHEVIEDGPNMALGDLAYLTTLTGNGVPRPVALGCLAVRLSGTVWHSIWDCDTD